MFKSLLVAFDGSEASRRALRQGAELARKLELPIRTVTVIEDIPAYVTTSQFGMIDSSTIVALQEQRDAFTKELLKEVDAVAAEYGVGIDAEATAGNPVDAIVDAVNKYGCSLLVIGLRHHPGLIERLTSHTGRDITERAPCSVMGVR